MINGSTHEPMLDRVSAHQVPSRISLDEMSCRPLSLKMQSMLNK